MKLKNRGAAEIRAEVVQIVNYRIKEHRKMHDVCKNSPQYKGCPKLVINVLIDLKKEIKSINLRRRNEV